MNLSTVLYWGWLAAALMRGIEKDVHGVLFFLLIAVLVRLGAPSFRRKQEDNGHG